MKLADAFTDWLIAEFQHPGYWWDSEIARYREKASGRRLVSEGRIQAAFIELGIDVTSFADETQLNMEVITEKYLEGGIDILEWQRGMRREIKDNIIVGTMVGRGGLDSMTRRDMAIIGGLLVLQFGHLDNMAWEQVAGEITHKQLQARVRMYAGKVRTAYAKGRLEAHKGAGFTEERRILNPAEHCADCIGYAALQWQPIGTLPEPGEASVCRGNCKCGKEFKSQVTNE